jgi:hypothetical protein
VLGLQVFGGTGGNVTGPEALVLWQLIGAGVSMVVAPMAYSCKVSSLPVLPFWELMLVGGVDVWLAGHVHIYCIPVRMTG